MGKIKRDRVQQSPVATVRERHQISGQTKFKAVKKVVPAPAPLPAPPPVLTPSIIKLLPSVTLQKVPDLPARLGDPRDTVKRQSKKDKLKERKDLFKRKIDGLDKAKRQVATMKKAKKQKKTIQKVQSPAVRSALLANFAAIKDALPTLDDSLPSLNSLFQLKAKGLQKTGVAQFDEAATRKESRKKKIMGDDGVGKKITKATKLQEKKNEFMQRCKHFKALTKDKTFKRNPREMIAMHIRNRQLANGVIL